MGKDFTCCRSIELLVEPLLDRFHLVDLGLLARDDGLAEVAQLRIFRSRRVTADSGNGEWTDTLPGKVAPVQPSRQFNETKWI
jgi:hypothetical protein